MTGDTIKRINSINLKKTDEHDKTRLTFKVNSLSNVI